MEQQINIDLMPLTSMALIILLILMIMSPGIANRGIAVNLPASETAEDEKPANVVVALAEDGRIEVNGIETDISGLRPLLGGELKTSPERVVLIRADKNLLYSDIEFVLRLCRECGAEKIALGAERKK